MIRRLPLVASLASAALLGALSFPAAADMPCGPMGGAHAMHGQGADAMARHHAKLHDALQLTPEQEAGWQKMLDTEHPRGMERASAGTPDEWARLSTPERADRMLERMRAHEAAMGEHVAALKTFYASLTPAQQKIFDDAHRNAIPRGHHRQGRKPVPMISPPTS